MIKIVLKENAASDRRQNEHAGVTDTNQGATAERPDGVNGSSPA
jgi:hypothetical protein